jgi:carbon monoxide dehydrogenase subunit G
MKIDNAFLVDLPVAQAWALLLDIPSVVPCMPGAALLAVEDERTYRGQVTVRLGPVTVTFQGRARIEAIDEAARSVRVKASGTETKGRGSAQAEVSFAMQPEGNGTRVAIATDLALAGAVAQYGRAQGVIADVAQVVIDTFAQNLRNRIAAAAPAGEPHLPPTVTPPPPSPAFAGAGSSRLGALSPASTAPDGVTRLAPQDDGVGGRSSRQDLICDSPAPTPAAASPAPALSAWSVLVAVVRRWLGRLTGRASLA